MNGIRIKNYEAASIFEKNIGTRTKMDSTEAVLSYSLFLDFLKDNGLNVWKEKSTRDVVCIAFDYGCPSYEEDITKHQKKIKDIQLDETKTEEQKQKEISIHNNFIEQANINKDKYIKKSKEDLRTMFYVNGVNIEYDNETIHYKMLYRTPGKAKKGTCMFIREELHQIAQNFLYMGIELPKENSPIVEIGAYASLVTSYAEARIHIEPEQILILNDVKTTTVENVVSIFTNELKQCCAKDIENYELENQIFDGQALIDSSIFPEFANGYILLRHHMTKCAAFSTNIQLFMQDYFGDKYETAEVTDMFGNKHKAKDIRLITTDNAIKWLKFKVSFDYWADWVRANGCTWGIVKTAHESKFGDVQRTSYQMINSLDLSTMENVAKYSKDYIERLRKDDDAFIEYLKKNITFCNDYDVLIALVEHNPDFVRSEYFRDRKSAIIGNYANNFKSGRTLQNADNLTIVGSPYAMLLHSVGESVYDDPTFTKEEGAIQCWTARFEDGEYLAEFRSPFNSRNNLGCLHNHYHPYMDRYFNLGRLCIAVNMIETSFQDRNNGSDMDSDSIYTTNHPDIVAHAKYCHKNYPTIVNNIPKEKSSYSLSLENYAEIDNKLMKCQSVIGESSNLAQICLTYTYNFDDKKYYDYTCILAVLA